MSQKGVQGINMTWIVVKDIKAAIQFYTEVVGLTLGSESPEFGWAELSGPEGSRLGDLLQFTTLQIVMARGDTPSRQSSIH